MNPGFPNWMRALDPLLEGEDSNNLYQMFWTRRRVYTSPGWLAHLPATPWGLAKALGMVVLTLLSIALTVFACWCLIVIPIAAAAAIRFIGQKSQIDSSLMPRKVGHVFSPNGTHRQAAVDLWLSGVRGSEVEEAIYLESAIGRLLSFLLLYGIVFLTVIILYAANADAHFVFKLFFLASFLWFAWKFLFTSCEHMVSRVALQRARDRIASWRGELKPHAIALREAWSAFYFLFISGFVLGGLLCFFSMFDSAAGSAMAGAIFIAMGFLSRHQQEEREGALQQSYNAQKLRADEAFDIFMAGTVVGDPLGRSWAIWYHEPSNRVRREGKNLYPMFASDDMYAMQQEIPDDAESIVDNLDTYTNEFGQRTIRSRKDPQVDADEASS